MGWEGHGIISKMELGRSRVSAGRIGCHLNVCLCAFSGSSESFRVVGGAMAT